MNPLVEQMLNATVSNDVETRLLEDLFERDCECESDHGLNGDPCTFKVTARCLGKCGVNRMLCENAARGAEKAIQEAVTSCYYCRQDIEKCWTIRPI